MTASSPYKADLNQLRRRLRGISPSALMHAIQEALDSLDVPAIAADNTGRYVAANQRMCVLTGYTLPELLQLSVIDLTPALRRSSGKMLWNQFIQAGSQTGQYVLRRKDGTSLTVKYSAYASIAPGVHLSLLAPADSPSAM